MELMFPRTNAASASAPNATVLSAPANKNVSNVLCSFKYVGVVSTVKHACQSVITMSFLSDGGPHVGDDEISLFSMCLGFFYLLFIYFITVWISYGMTGF